MRQYNVGCPLPDCKCGAPNCTGTLGSITGSAPDKVESDAISTDVVKQRRSKRLSKSPLRPEPTEKKKKPSVAKREHVENPAHRSSSVSRALGRNQESSMNERPTIIFKRALDSSKSQLHIRDTPSPVRRTMNRRSKPINGLKGLHGGSESKDSSENVVVDKLLSRALLKGSALETFPNSASSQKLGNNRAVAGKVNESRRTRRIAELGLSNGTVKAKQ